MNKYPEVDAYEQQVTSALAARTDLNARYRTELLALQFLETAEANMVSLCAHYKESLPIFYMSQDYKKQMVLEKAHRILAEAPGLATQAKYIQPDIKFIPPIPPEASIEEASKASGTTLRELRNQIVAEKRWITALQSGQEQAEKDVEQAREDLRRVRKSIFERIVSQGSNPPPEYEE